MRSLRIVIAAAAMVATAAIASPTAPQNNAEYTTLATPQPTAAVGKKIEVIEFFAYHCPACNVMEPYVDQWKKKHEADVTFKRIPMPFGGPTDPEARLYLTLEAMGKADEVGPKVFRAFHAERKRLTSDQAILDWVGTSSGLDKAKFTEMWNSFGVLTKLRRLEQVVKNYKVTGTPTFVVDGRFITSPQTVGQANPSITPQQTPDASNAVLTALVNIAKKDKGYAAAPAAAAPAKAPAKK